MIFVTEAFEGIDTGLEFDQPIGKVYVACCRKGLCSDPVLEALDVVNGRWALHVVRAIDLGHRRFNDLRRSLGINPSSLNERLEDLERAGLILQVEATVHAPAGYQLTPLGVQLAAALKPLGDWACDNMETLIAASPYCRS